MVKLIQVDNRYADISKHVKYCDTRRVKEMLTMWTKRIVRWWPNWKRDLKNINQRLKKLNLVIWCYCRMKPCSEWWRWWRLLMKIEHIFLKWRKEKYTSCHIVHHHSHHKTTKDGCKSSYWRFWNFSRISYGEWLILQYIMIQSVKSNWKQW